MWTALAPFCSNQVTHAQVLEMMVWTPIETAGILLPPQILHMASAKAQEPDFHDTLTQIWNHAYMTPTHIGPDRQTHLRSILTGQNPQPTSLFSGPSM